MKWDFEVGESEDGFVFLYGYFFLLFFIIFLFFFFSFSLIFSLIFLFYSFRFISHQFSHFLCLIAIFFLKFCSTLLFFFYICPVRSRMVYNLESILTACLAENTKGINLGLTQHKSSKTKLATSTQDTAAITLSGTWVALNAWIENRLSKQKVKHFLLSTPLNLDFSSSSLSPFILISSY